MRRHSFMRIGNAMVSVVAVAAWLFASNHCALAGAMQKHVAVSSVHEHCPAHSTPEKKSTEEDLPCCKSLVATSVPPAKNVGGYDTGVFVSQQYPSIESLLALWHSDSPIAEVDTGPPRGDSFTESERSVLAHAPPISLS